MRPAPLDAAAAYLVDRHPGARAAFLGSSVLTDAATATSDLDVLVLLGAEHDDAAYVETTTHAGWLVEAFVYGPAGLRTWLQRGRAERHPVLDTLAAHGVPLLDSAEGQALARESQRVLDAGPGSPSQAALDRRRYALSALIDDLAGLSHDDAEAYAVAGAAFQAAAELTLLVDHRWLSTGKWLVRELRRGASDDAHGLLAWADGPARDVSRLIGCCRSVLAAAGGYLQAGYLRGARPTD